MAIRGSLKEASLPDVLQLLAMGKKTGCLSVTHRNNFGSIFFDRGRITYAAIVNRRDRLGDMLVKNEVISQEQLDTAIESQAQHREKRIGELLVDGGALTREELQHFIKVQIEEAVYFLFTWTQGTFNFDADIEPDAQDMLVSINPESLLLEGARRVDEWGLIEAKIPSFDVVFEIDRPKLVATEASLTPEQEIVLTLVDGIRDVQGVIDASGLVEFEVGKALYGLATAGFIHRIGTAVRARVVAGQGDDARTEEHRNLGIAFYRTGMLDEALREFRRALDLRPSDSAALLYCGLTLARQQQWAEAEHALSDATRAPGAKYTIYHNLAFVLERLGKLDEAATAIDEALVRGGEGDARVETTRGVVALRRGDSRLADELLTAARDFYPTSAPPPATWFHFAALAAAVRGDLRRAEALLVEGVEAHPAAAVLSNNLAVVLERLGLFADAERRLEAGIHEDPSLPQLQKNLGDVLLRTHQPERAFDAYTRATKLRPDLGTDVYTRIGVLNRNRGKRADAEQALKRALELDPGNDSAKEHLAALSAQAGAP